MTRTLVVDLDGVLRRWEPVGPIEARYGLPDGALFATAFSPALLTPVITGAVDDERWRADVAAALVAAHGPAAAAAVARWSESSGTVDQDVLDLVRRHRRRAPVVALTNATSRLRHDLTRLGLDRELDRVFSSHELGVAKPDPRVFALVCAQLATGPADCLFVDDTAGHVAAAAAAGLRAHHFRTPGELARFLAQDGSTTIPCR